jgi:hypothetical protein
VFFCRDPIQGPDVIRSQYRNPKNFLFDYHGIFDLLANTPESNHAGLMFFSDHGTPKGWRGFHGYGCHAFKWVNAEGKFVYIKYHFIAKHGQKQFTQQEATQMCGEDPDYSKRDLWETIERGEEVEYTAMVQVMEPQDADPDKLGFDPFDVTKVWPRSQFPMQEFGRLVLNKNPENYHRDVEQAGFSPGSMVPGIEDSPDPLLQFRMFFYRDAQYHRIGVNLHQIPVNCPFMAKSYASLNFDGQMRTDANHAGNKQYAPNSYAHKFRPDVAEAPYQVSDNVVSRKSHYWHEGKKNDYDQAKDLWSKVMTQTQRDNTIKNTGNMLKFVTCSEIQVGENPPRAILDACILTGPCRRNTWLKCTISEQTTLRVCMISSQRKTSLSPRLKLWLNTAICGTRRRNSVQVMGRSLWARCRACRFTTDAPVSGYRGYVENILLPCLEQFSSVTALSNESEFRAVRRGLVDLVLLNTWEKETYPMQGHLKHAGKEICSLRTSCVIMMVLNLVNVSGLFTSFMRRFISTQLTRYSASGY